MNRYLRMLRSYGDAYKYGCARNINNNQWIVVYEHKIMISEKSLPRSVYAFLCATCRPTTRVLKFEITRIIHRETSQKNSKYNRTDAYIIILSRCNIIIVPQSWREIRLRDERIRYLTGNFRNVVVNESFRLIEMCARGCAVVPCN